MLLIYYITYNYCYTNFVARNYPFYRVDAETEDLATTVLSEKYKIPFLKFKSGKDGGRDAVAKRTNIDLGGGNVLTDQNVVVQVKHTIYESEKFNDAIRKRKKLKNLLMKMSWIFTPLKSVEQNKLLLLEMKH